MTKLEQAARQALEALESYSKSDYIKKQHPKRRANGEKAITALREALAEQAEQEPVAFQAREIGEGDWFDVGLDEVTRITGIINSPHIDYRWLRQRWRRKSNKDA